MGPPNSAVQFDSAHSLGFFFSFSLSNAVNGPLKKEMFRLPVLSTFSWWLVERICCRTTFLHSYRLFPLMIETLGWHHLICVSMLDMLDSHDIQLPYNVNTPSSPALCCHSSLKLPNIDLKQAGGSCSSYVSSELTICVLGGAYKVSFHIFRQPPLDWSVDWPWLTHVYLTAYTEPSLHFGDSLGWIYVVTPLPNSDYYIWNILQIIL